MSGDSFRYYLIGPMCWCCARRDRLMASVSDARDPSVHQQPGGVPAVSNVETCVRAVSVVITSTYLSTVSTGGQVGISGDRGSGKWA